jgi:hypothetical protein
MASALVTQRLRQHAHASVGVAPTKGQPRLITLPQGAHAPRSPFPAPARGFSPPLA